VEKIALYSRRFRFDIGLLTRRLVAATEWVFAAQQARNLKIGYFGASTGAAAAIQASTLTPGTVHAIVSRGGRPDLAGEYLSLLSSPTLFIVGGNDDQVIQLNVQAMQKIQCEKRLEIIPGATHLFEEAGALDQVGRFARSWFQRYLC
jgi:dienelactone hydrolase